jgi:hypothetical protein
MKLRPALALILVPAGLLSVASGQSSRDVTLDPVVEAWSQRQKYVRSARFVWNQDLTVRKVNGPDEAPSSAQGPPDGGSRVGDLVDVTQRITMILDGERVAFVVETQGGKVLDMPPFYKSTYDGTASQMYAVTEPDDPKLGTGTGVIRSERHAFDVDSIQFRPLMLTLRAVHPALAAIDPAEYRVSPERGRIGDVSCLIIEHAGDQQPHKFYWVDPDRDFIVLREHETYRGVDRIRKDISYQRDPVHGWLPSGWKFVNLDERGELRESAVATVAEYAINATIPPSEFQIEYPKGTYLVDARSGMERPQWVGGNPAGAPASTSTRRLLLMNLGLIVIGVALFFARRYLRSQSRQGD